MGLKRDIMTTEEIQAYEADFIHFLQEECEVSDAAHDIKHLERVVRSAKHIATQEKACQAVVIPAAWLHDCVSLPKNHPERHLASKYAADKAVEFLKNIGYPNQYHSAIHHAILSHSFSANCEPQSLEAKIVQDADRLDALGAIGIARCIQVSTVLKRTLYAPEDAFCEYREPDDQAYSIDHFYRKLFTIAASLNTASARREGQKREQVMRDFLDALKMEI